MKRLRHLFIVISLLGSLSWHGTAQAEHLQMLRSSEPFPETMSLLQETIKKQGYTVSRVQRVDIGLSKSGYKTDKYRVVFFGKDKEIQGLLKSHPQIAPYLPLKIVIYAEQTDTILVSLDPDQFIKLFPDVKQQQMFMRWNKDVHAIFDQMRLKTKE